MFVCKRICATKTQNTQCKLILKLKAKLQVSNLYFFLSTCLLLVLNHALFCFSTLSVV